MFKRNNKHKQQELFNSFSWMNDKSKKMLMNSWAPSYYKNVFCHIDEEAFKVLYCEDNGRPNFPVNIMLSLEFIKHLKSYSDEELIEQFHFNYQIMFAVGIRNLGEYYLAPRTLYEFRERLYNYTLSHPEESDLIFKQFQELTKHFCELTNANSNEQRMDSTHVMPNIKRAGRLSLAYDILVTAVKSIPKDLLSKSLAKVLKSDFKTNLLYRSRTNEIKSRLEEVINLCVELLEVVSSRPDLCESESILLLKRFLKEQADFDDKTKKWTPKKNNDIPSPSVQSAFDSDATFRKKGNKKHVGYVLNIAETSAEENPVQFITDYTLKPNCVADTTIIEERLPVIKETYEDLKDLYVDGGYYSSDVVKQSEDLGIDIHYTNMTGTTSEKMSLTEFSIDENEGKLQVKCPAGLEAFPTYIGEGNTIIAHFNLSKCKECQLKAECPASPQKTSMVLKITTKSMIAAKTRQKLEDKDERMKSTSTRAAIEGTNSVLKRAQGADKLEVRTINKGTIVIGYKLISRNIRQLLRWAKGDYRRKQKKPTQTPSQGVGVPVCA